MKHLANVLTGHPYQNKKPSKWWWTLGHTGIGIMPDILMLQAFLRNVKDFCCNRYLHINEKD